MARRYSASTDADSPAGVLYVVGTPLGNLEDITLRARRVLAEVDLIAAEDTRRTGQLLRHLGINKPMVSCFQHNEQERTQELMQRLLQGANVALVSDAGMPGISDPGYIVIKAALDLNVTVTPVPGPTAVATALVISGLPTDRYVFEGFLPRVGKERRARLAALVGEERTMAFYEAPHRLTRTLADLRSSLGERPAAVARELTKAHEECVRGNLSALIDHFQARPPKGECVVLVGGAKPTAGQEAKADADGAVLKDLLCRALQAGMTRKDAVRQVVAQTGRSRKDVYQASLELDDGHYATKRPNGKPTG